MLDSPMLFVLIPDEKGSHRGFHDVTLVDMVDADAPVVPVADVCVLWRQWPLSVVSRMSRKHMDYESLRHKCKGVKGGF